MIQSLNRNIRLGIFVLAGTVFLIVAMYFIGSKQNLFGSKFKISTHFRNVGGLMAGNNVRFGGIDIGTVESVNIISDTSIRVDMVIKERLRAYIKKNTVASVGTDGLMGNRLVNLTPASGPAGLIENGDVLQSVEALETSEIFRKLDHTNDDVSVIARNLRILTERINQQNTLWSILMDPTVAENIKQAIVNIQITGQRTAILTGDLSRIVAEVKAGKGAVGALLTDTAFESNLKQTIVNIKLVSDTMAYISGDLRDVSKKIQRGDGAVGTLLMDTAFVHHLNQTMKNLDSGTAGFSENMEALKQNVLLRKYFKKQARKAAKPN